MYTTTVKKNSSTGEYVVRLFKDGKHVKGANYYTDDKQDAEATARSMREAANK